MVQLLLTEIKTGKQSTFDKAKLEGLKISHPDWYKKFMEKNVIASETEIAEKVQKKTVQEVAPAVAVSKPQANNEATNESLPKQGKRGNPLFGKKPVEPTNETN